MVFLNIFNNIDEKIICVYLPWIDEEINILNKLFPEIGAMGIVKRGLLPRHNYGSIKAKAYELGLIFNKVEAYIPNDIDDKILIENYSTLGKKGMLKLLPHMTEGQIKYRAKALGLSFNNHPWTEEEDKIIETNWNTCTYDEILAMLPGRTKAALFSHVSKKGLTKRNNTWTKEQDELFLKVYPEMGSKCFYMFPDKTANQCYERGRFYNIKGGRGFSKYRFVSKCNDKYKVCFTVDGKIKSFGIFTNEDEAGRVAIEKAKEYGKI